MKNRFQRASLAAIRAMKDAGELHPDLQLPEGPELGDHSWNHAVLSTPSAAVDAAMKKDAR